MHSTITPPGTQIPPAHHTPLLKETPVRKRKYLGNGGLDALVLHQLRYHRPAEETNPEVSGKGSQKKKKEVSGKAA
jgi:hypothetical protein